MHIKKLEITGFKSFVDRTVIHFDHDVIAIVGPNGCGKSNIVDAIRWCMGEQSAKHLRGRSMEDVIFNGSESRAAHGMAEVTLTFDNNDSQYAGALPSEYREFPEIAVTRRLYRDGTSEYLINKTHVRLRDVTELFLGTGVGTKAYSIVEQGRIGQIVSSRPQDRRLFIEEAAGITKYKQRRRQTERKLELTRQNLLRITDIVSEIDRTQASLKRQAAKAERFIRYRGELEELFLHDAAHRLLEMIVVERVARDAARTAESSCTRLRAAVGEQDQALEAARAEAMQVEAKTETISKEAFTADNRVASLRAESDRCLDRLVHLRERQEAAVREKDQIAAKRTELAEEAAALEERLVELSQDEEHRDADAAREHSELETLRARSNDAQNRVASERTTLSQLDAQLAGIEARREAAASRIESSQAALVARREELEALAAANTDREAQTQRLTAELNTADAQHTAERAQLDARKQELSRQREELGTLTTEVDGIRETLGSKRQRLLALEDWHARHEGVGAGAQALLGSGSKEVRGLLADRFDVPEDCTVAVAALLGERLQAVVIGSRARGIDLLSDLKQGGKGRATLIAASPAYTAGALSGVLDDAACVGCLAELVGYSPTDEPLARSLLGSAVLVDQSSDALRLSEQHPDLTFVARDGTIAAPGGLLSGGEGDNLATAMVEQKREMAELRELVTKLEAQLETARARQLDLQAKLSEAEGDVESLSSGLHQSELSRLTLQKDLTRAQAELQSATERRQRLEDELSTLESSVAEASQASNELAKQFEELEAARRESAAALEQATAEAQTAQEQTEAKATTVTERKVRLAQVREQLESARHALSRIADTRRELDERSTSLEGEMVEIASLLGETAARLLVAREQHVEAKATAQSTQVELDHVRELLEKIRGALSGREGELRQLRVDLTEHEEELRVQQMELQKLEIERRHLLGSVREKFRGLDLNHVVGDYHLRPQPDEEHRRRIDELTKLIDRMGPVNLDAKHEYEDAARRFEELSEQKLDIEKALADLDRAIRHMDRESKRRFRETFISVNNLFKSTFNKMFKGGQAELKLTDPDNLLETGVDIVAQPPGKKLGNIELMSGGEKALTATSLIFAMFQHRPSPFCVLDEVDAPLDEANVTRYNEAIRSMTDRSQFILITHIKKTMSSVDVLYGVTMGEPGVSRLVSVKVNNEAISRSERGPSQLDATDQAGSQVA